MWCLRDGIVHTTSATSVLSYPKPTSHSTNHMPTPRSLKPATKEPPPHKHTHTQQYNNRHLFPATLHKHPATHLFLTWSCWRCRRARRRREGFRLQPRSPRRRRRRRTTTSRHGPRSPARPSRGRRRFCNSGGDMGRLGSRWAPVVTASARLGGGLGGSTGREGLMAAPDDS